MAKTHRYPGDGIEITYDKKKCIHAAACVRSLPKVFNPRKRPWVDPDNADTPELISAVTSCPTGALQYEVVDAELMEKPDSSNTIIVEQNGALLIRGDVEIIGADGEAIDRVKRVALCRCGRSKNKPYCDGSHNEGFVDPGNIGEGGLRRVDAASEEATFTVTCAANGPLICGGPVTISSADRAEIVEGNKVALCRCGASSNKPYCDGTHKKIGFEAP